MLALARVDGDRAVRGDHGAGREGEAAQAGVAQVPAVERQRVDRVVVADPDPLAVDVLAVVAVGVPLGVEADRGALVGPEAAVAGREEALASGRGPLGEDAVALVRGVLGLQRPPQRLALGDEDAPDVAPAPAAADRDRAQPAAARAARREQRGDADAALGLLDELLEPVGGVDRVAVTGALGGPVGRLLHRLDARDAHAQEAAEAVPGHVGVERVAVIDVADLAVPHLALGAVRIVGQAGAALGQSGGSGEDEGARDGEQYQAYGRGHRRSQQLAGRRVAACNYRCATGRSAGETASGSVTSVPGGGSTSPSSSGSSVSRIHVSSRSASSARTSA